MKKLSLLFVALAVIAFIGLTLAGCGSKPVAPEPPAEPKGEIVVETKVYPPKNIEHKKSALGGEVPNWVFEDQMDLEASDKYKDYYVFKFDERGESLDGVKAWTRSFVAATEVSRMVSTRVMNKFGGAQVGDKNMVETYMEEVAKILSEAQYAGARKMDDFWVYQQHYKDDGKPDKKLYMYLFLYTVPREQIDAAIARALDDQAGKAKPKTEEEQVARDRVKELFSDGM